MGGGGAGIVFLIPYTKPYLSIMRNKLTCEDPPGYREGPAGKLYLAYLRDPDGNKLCALHRPG